MKFILYQGFKNLLAIGLIIFSSFPFLFSQSNFNANLVSNLDYTEGCNDVWGYKDRNGIEYAIMGTRLATSIVSLEDPTDPQEVKYIPGANTTWRDMKSYGEHIYVVTDGRTVNDGVLIIDMGRNLGGTINHIFKNLEVVINGNTSQINACHNIYIDENGYAYLAGCNVNNGAPVIFDVFTTPGDPIFVGATTGAYSHDVFVRGDTLYSSDILEGYFSVWDVSDKANAVLLATQPTTTDFTHNAWLSDDGKYLFTTDEKPDAFTDSYDISDLSDIKRLDSYQPSETVGTGVLPHNAHYHEGYLVISHYSDGVKIVDAHRPENLVEVGSYDTFVSSSSGGNGCWGAYPFLPSGLLLASDQSNGLFVISPEYQRASYLEGLVQEEGSNFLLSGATVEIQSDLFNLKKSNSLGQYKTGIAESGTFQVTFSLRGYESKTVEVMLTQGELTTLNVQLKKLATFSFTGNVIDDASEAPLTNASVVLEGVDFTYNTTTDENGNVNLSEVVIGEYLIYAGQWGYQEKAIGRNINETTDLSIRLEEGYKDDFVVDQGWTTTSENASSGFWEIGEPNGTTYIDEFSNPGADVDGDLGKKCYVTGNAGGSAGQDDVDNGIVTLSSPFMDLSSYEEATIRYHTWFFNDSGNSSPNDTLKVYLQTPDETVMIETITESKSEWSEAKEFKVSDFLQRLDAVQIIFETADLPGAGHLVEAGVDAFEAFDAAFVSSTVQIDANIDLRLSPNPFHYTTTLNYHLDESLSTGEAGPNNDSQVTLYNYLGQAIRTFSLSLNTGNLEIGEDLPNGIYFLQVQQKGKVSKTVKLVKQ